MNHREKSIIDSFKNTDRQAIKILAKSEKDLVFCYVILNHLMKYSLSVKNKYPDYTLNHDNYLSRLFSSVIYYSECCKEFKDSLSRTKDTLFKDIDSFKTTNRRKEHLACDMFKDYLISL